VNAEFAFVTPTLNLQTLYPVRMKFCAFEPSNRVSVMSIPSSKMSDRARAGTVASVFPKFRSPRRCHTEWCPHEPAVRGIALQRGRRRRVAPR